MRRISLGSPYKRHTERTPREFAYPVGGVSPLPRPSAGAGRDFFQVVNGRASRREWAPLAATDLSTLLWHSARTISTQEEDSGFVWQHRPAPSGGGRHPVDILVLEARAGDIRLYDPQDHALAFLCPRVPSRLRAFLRKVETVLPVGDGTLLWLAAQPDRTLSKYARGECLVWLDAGALLATVCVVAEALGLNCCAIGITGEPWISGLLGAEGAVEGLCGCVVGARP